MDADDRTETGPTCWTLLLCSEWLLCLTVDILEWFHPIVSLWLQPPTPVHSSPPLKPSQPLGLKPPSPPPSRHTISPRLTGVVALV
jgi:hypothetical protein